MRSKILIAVIFICNLSYAQTDTALLMSHPKIIVFISGGQTVPLGKYSKFEVNDGSNYNGYNMAGAAKIGFNERLNVIYLFSKNFGMNFTVFSTTNKAAAPDSADLFYDPCSSCHGLGGGSSMQSFTYNTATWFTNGFLIGFSAALYNYNTVLVLRVNAGLQKTKSPETHLHEEGYTWQINWPTTYPYTSDLTQPAMTSKYNFATGGGVDLIIELKSNIAIIVSMDYLNSKASFIGIESGYLFSFDKNITLFNFNIGIGYSIKSKR